MGQEGFSEAAEVAIEHRTGYIEAAAGTEKLGGAGRVTIGIDVSARYSHLCVLGHYREIVREERVRSTT